jgi:hypothetical protein
MRSTGTRTVACTKRFEILIESVNFTEDDIQCFDPDSIRSVDPDPDPEGQK